MDKKHDASHVPIESVKEILEFLDARYMPLMRALNSAALASDLPPECRSLLPDLRATLQVYLELVGSCVPDVTESKQSAPAKTAPLTAANIGGPTPETAAAEAIPTRARKARDPAYDFLLLEAFEHQAAFGSPIGQKTLFDIAQAFDPSIKKPALISKINRMKYNGLLEWSTHEDIKRTDRGKSERDRLYLIVKRDDDLNKLAAILHKGLRGTLINIVE